VFLVIVGASWDPRAWQGWAIAGTFTVARLYGKALGGRLIARHIRGLPSASVITSALLPQSPIAVVVMVAASMLHGQQSPEIVRWMVNAILVSAVLTELIAFFVRRRVVEQAAT
jgi:Kef-type K+ transport system membrane component KefB